jgi:hypothetical protein
VLRPTLPMTPGQVRRSVANSIIRKSLLGKEFASHMFKGFVPSKLFNNFTSPPCSAASSLSALFASNTAPLILRGSGRSKSAAPHAA